MTKIDVTLVVVLKGADLYASTATLTLRDTMGLGERLAGLKRMHRYRFTIETTADVETVIAALERVLDRRSTFYNRNKHEFALEATWDGGTHAGGLEKDVLRERWFGALRNRGAAAGGVYALELGVSDDDRGAVDALGSVIETDLANIADTGAARVKFSEASTVWWLAIAAAGENEAREEAEKIAVTRSRDEGLLANPNYQTVIIGPARALEAPRA